jgi:hypothetical protein
MRTVVPATLTLLAALAASGAEPPAEARPAPAARAETLAREAGVLLARGDTGAVAARFTPEMKAALPGERFREFWDSLPAQLGALKSIGAPSVRSEGGFDVADLPAAFERTAVVLRVVFDGEGRIAGFRVLPGSPPAAWSPAGYADPAKAKEREVTVGSGEWALPATLTLPAAGDGPFPAIVLVHGSGPHDRDETVGGVKPFRDLAGGLAARGVAVLRYEKRTKVHGARLKDAGITVKEEVVDDALAAAALLRGRPEVDAKRVSLLGHSLGGMLAPRIAAADPGLAGIAIVAGNARPLHVLALEQLDTLVSTGSATKEQTDGMRGELEKVGALDPSKPPADGTRLMGAPVEYWLDLARYDPAATVRGLGMPVLVLAGGRDYQVTVKDFEAWKAALSSRPNVSFRLFPKLNHLLVDGEGPSTPAEYERPGHVSQEVVEAVAAWARALPPRAGP